MARTKARKISVTVNADVLDSVKERLRRSRKSLSAYVSDALAEEVQRERWRDIVAEFEREHGAFTAAERKKARGKIARVLGHRVRAGRAA